MKMAGEDCWIAAFLKASCVCLEEKNTAEELVGEIVGIGGCIDTKNLKKKRSMELKS